MFAAPDQKVVLNYSQTNRQRLMNILPENSAVLIYSGDEKIRNRDVEYRFRPSSDFFYLTAFCEPESICLLIKKSVDDGQIVNHFNLFLREKDPLKETWEGRRLGVEAAGSIGVDQAFSIDEFASQLPELLQGCQNIYFSFSELEYWSALLEPVINEFKNKSRQGVESANRLEDLDALLHELRLFKQPLEIDWLRKACQISVQGHLCAMQAVDGGKNERQVQGDLENGFWQSGAIRESFNSIVAGGSNACILHYTENNQPLVDGDLVLVDAGAEYNCYAGDITSTFPVNGRFSKEQAQIYNLVLAAQNCVIEMVKPGVLFNALHQRTLEVLTEGLVALQILEGDVEELIEQQAYKPFFMHGTGHWLGMDVHDVGQYKQNTQWRALEPGMVFTVEPGLYLSGLTPGLDSKWHDIGVRIEDDILVTDTGYEVLTSGLPRTVTEIEEYMLHRKSGA